MSIKYNKKLISILFVVSMVFVLLCLYCNIYKEQISLDISGKEIKVSTFKKTVKDLLAEQNIYYDSNDKISPSLNSKTKDNMSIKIVKVDIKSTKEYVEIPYVTNIIEDNSMIKGVTIIEQNGANGRKEVTYNLVFEDNNLVEKKLIKETVCSKPVDKIIKKGTKEVFVLTSRGEISRGHEYKYMNVVATAYSGDTITSTGTTPKWGTIAVDPRVIPYGSKVYIPTFNTIFTAEDCGGAIKGNKIDIFMQSESQCNKWGRRTIEVYVIN